MAAPVETSLSVLVPTAIVDANFTSSTVPETDYAVWAGGTTYAVGDHVIKSHRIYESLKASNTGNDPDLEANQVGSPAWWLDDGPTNRWAVFDNEVSTQTHGTSPLTFVVHPGFINALYLGNIDAEHLAITIKDAPGGTIVWSYNQDLENSMPPDYYEYFFSPFQAQTDFLAGDIPPYSAMEVTVTLTRTSGECRVGMFSCGDLRPLGSTQYGAKVKPKTYSTITTDKFGNTSIVKRKAASDMSATGILTTAEANATVTTLQDVLDVPCVIIGTDLPEYAGLRVFGLISGEVEYVNYAEAQVNVNVQGMI